MTTNTHIAAHARFLADNATTCDAGMRKFLRECAQALEAVPALDAQGETNEGTHDGTKSRDGENDTSASQDEGHDASRVGGESGPAAEQHHEHRVGKSNVDREHDQRDCRGAGVHGAFDLPPQVVQTPAFIYNGETYRDLESMLEGYTFGTAFYADPPLPHAVGKPLSEQQPMSDWRAEKMAGDWIAGPDTGPVDLIRQVESFHGIVTKEPGNG